ncbi:ABC transporter ATP-binding protein/permease [Lentilactobacillus diolivorans]|uniref:ABC transporter ATP-binding protein n=1 Tax=Lentilactobacillus diolivorans TaxID=179838 RepID=UPI00246962CE|nr:ABC transporter ATP-binding protein [Lentilactobacillus diolivorans]MDH5106859.1 ABC transporter ATP-binding protein/permease [Lentilactobacillus diolivorans]
MIKLIRSRISYLAVLGAVLFLVLQVMSDLYLPTVTSNIIDKGIAQNNIGYIWQEGFKMILVSFLGVAAAGGNIFFAATQSMKMGQKIRDDMFDKVTHFSEADMNRFGAASLDTRTTNDVVQIQNVMVQILRMMLMAPFMLIGASTMAFVKSPRLTIIFLITLPVIALIVGVLMYYVVPLFKVLQKKTDRINLIFGETLTGVRTIRSFNQDHYENRRFDAANKDFANTGIRAFTIVSFIIPIVTIVFSFINVAIIWFGGQMVSNQSLAVGNLVAFMTYSGQILFSFMMLSMIFVFLPRASASATRINEVLSVKDTITDPAIPVDFPVQQSGTLSFEHVYFRYSNAEQQTLQDINFSAHAGQTVAIIGGTGSGKSTLINLIPRLFDPESGVVKINGVPVNQLTQHDLHEQISINQQQAILFAGTIRENMHYAKPDATDDEIWYALTIAQATEFITTENGGLDYHVEQNGDNFSGGQKQRLAIARTILKPAEIYIFDDSFSALDFETDAKLRMALKNDPQIKKAITVIVAQRISTVADADLIIVLDDCKISGIGSHKELAASNAVYQEILSSQIGQGGGMNNANTTD